MSPGVTELVRLKLMWVIEENVRGQSHFLGRPGSLTTRVQADVGEGQPQSQLHVLMKTGFLFLSPLASFLG